jgi:hypothetical protein
LDGITVVGSWFSMLAARERLNDVDSGIGWDWVGKFFAIEDGFSIDENGHVLAESVLVVEHVTAGGGNPGEVVFKRLPDGSAFDCSGRTSHMPLYILREANLWHLVLPNL